MWFWVWMYCSSKSCPSIADEMIYIRFSLEVSRAHHNLPRVLTAKVTPDDACLPTTDVASMAFAIRWQQLYDFWWKKSTKAQQRRENNVTAASFHPLTCLRSSEAPTASFCSPGRNTVRRTRLHIMISGAPNMAYRSSLHICSVFSHKSLHPNSHTFHVNRNWFWGHLRSITFHKELPVQIT